MGRAGVCTVLPTSPGTSVGPSLVDPGLFSALRTGYGALGIVASLDLAVVPIWMMEEVRQGTATRARGFHGRCTASCSALQVVAPVPAFRQVLDNVQSLANQCVWARTTQGQGFVPLIRVLLRPLCRYERFQFHFLPYTGGAAPAGASNLDAPAAVIVRANTTANVSGGGAGCWGGGSYASPVTPAPTAWNGVWPNQTSACTDWAPQT